MVWRSIAIPNIIFMMKPASMTGATMIDLVLNDFFWRAMLAGIGVALLAAPLGCFVVWRRMAYFGDTIAHAGLLGVALAFLSDMSPTLGVFTIAIVVAMALLFASRRTNLPDDALLGILSHSTLALGLVAISLMSWLRIDLNAYLFGDILAVSRMDLVFIYTTALIALAVLAYIWKPLLASTVHAELAQAEGVNPERMRVVFMLLLAAVIAAAMKLVGILLITSLLIIPAAAARHLSSTPERMAVLASILGILAVIGGLSGSLYFDTPSGPSIVVAAMLLFLAGLAAGRQQARG
jgi:zinc transport system permease protein